MLRIIRTKKSYLFGCKSSQGLNRSISSFSGSNANYLDDLYDLWKKDKKSVHPSWDAIFQAVDNGADLKDYLNPQNSNFYISGNSQSLNINNIKNISSNPQASTQNNVNLLIDAYQNFGHYMAKIDPFQGLFCKFPINSHKLSLSFWNLDNVDKNTKFSLPGSTYIGNGSSELSLSEIISRLEKSYTGSIGLEISHLIDPNATEWLKKRLESRIFHNVEKEFVYGILNHLVKSTIFEGFLAKKYPSEKRFGLEGCETLVSLLREIIDTSAENKVESVVLGIAHRGRLNVLANVCEQSPHHIFMRFNDELEMEGSCSSDVKYHLGLSRLTKTARTGKNIKVSMIANPSHLEAVNPVVKGRVKAEQYLIKDEECARVMPILIHGDSAFAGQGIVYETINMSGLAGYYVGGTIHVVTNNQIGFTTDPQCSRSTYYCTEVGKISHAPIIHVNADDPEAVFFVAQLAADFRNTFKKDIIIDLIGYRRNGHNEGDNPQFTQPEMYDLIAKRPNSLEIYSRKLIESGVIDENYVKNVISSYEEFLNNEFEESQKALKVDNSVWIDSPWKNFFPKKQSFELKETGFCPQKLVEFQKKCFEVPEGFTLHPMIKRILNQRLEMLGQNKFDWAMGEIAAFSSLLTSGIHVRLTGQDVERGTFSHRHHVLSDYKNHGVKFCALDGLDGSQERYSLHNSPLSEYSVLGYEHGYSMASPKILAIWEAQFGDFANNAQVTIDQFISSGEDKWIRQSGLVMLLPHGFDGMGPEHSSSRLERYLQLAREDPDIFPSYDAASFEVRQLHGCNYIVAYPTTPANIFHLLRRQVAYDFRKPLVVMSPKNLLRHNLAKSDLSEFSTGTYFRRFIQEDGICSNNPNKVKRLILCSGKIYYELLQMREEKNLDESVAISRIEQLSPFPFDLVAEEIQKYSKADIMYVQEEPKNQGAYYFVRPMILLCGKYSKPLLYSGRDVSVSPATGSKYRHNIEQKSLLNNAFNI